MISISVHETHGKQIRNLNEGQKVRTTTGLQRRLYDTPWQQRFRLDNYRDEI